MTRTTPESYSLAEAAAVVGRSPALLVAAIRRGLLQGTQRRGWPEPRVTRVALVCFAIEAGLRLRS